MSGAADRGRGGLRGIDGALSPRNDPVARLHRFQGEHPEVGFTAPHMGGRGRYIARIPAGTIPGDPREVTVSATGLGSLMDQLGEIYQDEAPAGDARAGCQGTAGT